jgi:hypothetical protein
LEETINKKQDDIAVISENEIKAMISMINLIDQSVEKSRDEVSIGINKIIEGFAEILEPKQYTKIKKFEKTFDISMLSSFVALFYLSFLTYSHISSTRYPEGKVKPDSYTPNLGIVKTAPELFNIADKVANSLKKYIEAQNV